MLQEVQFGPVEFGPVFGPVNFPDQKNGHKNVSRLTPQFFLAQANFEFHLLCLEVSLMHWKPPKLNDPRHRLTVTMADIPAYATRTDRRVSIS